MAPTNPKPQLNLLQAGELTERLYGLMVDKIDQLPSYYDQNFHIMDKEKKEYILKIVNWLDSEKPAMLEVQTQAMGHLRQQGLPTQAVFPTVSRQLMSMEQMDCGFGSHTYCVRLLSFQPGKPIAESSPSLELLYQVGKMAATMNKELAKMVSPNLYVLQRDDFFWSLSNAPLVEDYLHVMDGSPLQDVVKSVIEQYKASVQPKLGSFEKGIIHGDVSDMNIIVQPVDNGSYKVSGILDFGLLSINCKVFEVAIAILYPMLTSPSPMDVGGAVLAGWENVMSLTEAERDSLYVLVLCRLCQSLVMGLYGASQHPENRDYLLATFQNGSRLLTTLWKRGKKEVEDKWFQDARDHTQRHTPRI